MSIQEDNFTLPAESSAAPFAVAWFVFFGRPQGTMRFAIWGLGGVGGFCVFPFTRRESFYSADKVNRNKGKASFVNFIPFLYTKHGLSSVHVKTCKRKNKTKTKGGLLFATY